MGERSSLDVVLQLGRANAKSPADALLGWFSRRSSTQAVVVVAKRTMRQAAELGAVHVILELDGWSAMADIQSVFSSRRLARDLSGRQLRFHLLVSTSPDEADSIRLLQAVVDVSRGRRIVLWSESAIGESTPSSALLSKAVNPSRILGAVRLGNPGGGVDDTATQLAVLLHADASDDSQSESAVEGDKAERQDAANGSQHSDDSMESQLERHLNRIEANLSSRLDGVVAALAQHDRLLEGLAETLDAQLRSAGDRVAAQVIADLDRGEASRAEAAEDRSAAQLESMANAWAGYVKMSVVEAASLFIQRSNAAFGERAEHFTRRLEAFSQTELDRDKRFSQVAGRAAEQATATALRSWIAPYVGGKASWFALGSTICAAMLAVGVVAGFTLARVLN